MTPLVGLLLALLPPGQIELDAVLGAAHRQAQAAADAVMQQQYEEVVERTYPRVVAQMGGKAKMIENVKKLVEDMKAKGFAFVSLKVEAPTRAVRSGRELVTVVPQVVEMSTPAGKAKARSFLVGVSANQ